MYETFLHHPIISQILPKYLSNVSLLQLKHTNHELKNIYPNINSYKIKINSQEEYDCACSKSMIDYIQPPKYIDITNHIIAANSYELLEYCYKKGYPINKEVVENCIINKYTYSYLWLKQNNFVSCEEILWALQKNLCENGETPENIALHYLSYWNEKIKETQKPVESQRQPYSVFYLNIDGSRTLNPHISCGNIFDTSNINTIPHENPYVMHSIVSSLTVSNMIRNEAKEKPEATESLNNDNAVIVCNTCGLSDIHYAAMYSTNDILDTLAQPYLYTNIEYEDNYHRNPLHVAAKYQNTETISWLLYNGAEQKFDDFLYTPLHYTINNNDINSCKILIENKGLSIYNPNPNRRRNSHPHSCNIIHFAISTKNEQIVEILCKNNALEDQTFNGDFPLDMAELHGNENIVSILCKYSYIRRNNNYSFVQCKNYTIIKILSEYNVV